MTKDDEGSWKMPAKAARVLCYSGYKADETPRAILVDDTEIAIKKILSRKRIRDVGTGRIREVFEGKTDRGVVRMEKDDQGNWSAVFL